MFRMSRRSLLGSSTMLFSPAIIRPARARLFRNVGDNSSLIWPGQAGYAVGFSATPVSAPSAWTVGTWPGAYSSLTAWPGGTGAQTISAGTHAQSGTGTALDPYIFSFFDFDALTSGTTISLAHVKFVGCRFQSNNTANFNVFVNASDVSFVYCSVVPRVALHTAPPNAAWPSSSALLNITRNSGTYSSYTIPYADGYQYGFNGQPNLDHCDIWGFGNAVNFGSGGGSFTIGNCWIHDPRNDNSNTDHTDGPGYLDGTTPPSNFTIKGNTIAGIGNTNGIALQGSTSIYNGVTVTGNYLTGWGDTISMCPPSLCGNGTNLTFTDNVIGVDLPWLTASNHYTSGEESLWTFTSNPTNLWRRNKISVPAGNANAMWAGLDGQFYLPTGFTPTSASDWSL